MARGERPRPARAGCLSFLHDRCRLLHLAARGPLPDACGGALRPALLGLAAGLGVTSAGARARRAVRRQRLLAGQRHAGLLGCDAPSGGAGPAPHSGRRDAARGDEPVHAARYRHIGGRRVSAGETPDGAHLVRRSGGDDLCLRAVPTRSPAPPRAAVGAVDAVGAVGLAPDARSRPVRRRLALRSLRAAATVVVHLLRPLSRPHARRARPDDARDAALSHRPRCCRRSRDRRGDPGSRWR